MPRFVSTTTNVLGPPLQLVDGPSFYYAYREIWQKRCYEFAATSQQPLIIDAGANVGLSVLFFKSLYPQSRIVAFEPDPAVFRVLEANVRTFGLTDVVLINEALAAREGVLRFHSEGADGGRLVDGADANDIQVPATRLSPYLSEPVDLLKIDIEGAETDVLIECRERLAGVRHLFAEFHSFVDRAQTLHTVLSIMHDAGFRVHLQPVSTSQRPFMHRQVSSGMDMQVNIFAFRGTPSS